MSNNMRRSFALLIALIGWFAVLVQFYLMMMNRETSVTQTIFRFFGFFTIDTNILVAICFSAVAFNKNSGAQKFFTKDSTITAITVYILIVGLVYNIVLRPLWDPQGLQKIIDELLHSVTPVLTLLYWIMLVSKKELKWKQAFTWLLYPLAYMIYCLINGALTGFYPYPFVDVNNLGYAKTFINAGVIFAIILLLSFVLIGLGRGYRSKINTNQ